MRSISRCMHCGVKHMGTCEDPILTRKPTGNNFRELATSLPAQSYNHLISFVAKCELMDTPDLVALKEAITLTAVEERGKTVTSEFLTAVYTFLDEIEMEAMES